MFKNVFGVHLLKKNLFVFDDLASILARKYFSGLVACRVVENVVIIPASPIGDIG